MNKNEHKSKIGGQAVIEGVMMRGLDKACMAVRKPDGEIHTESWDMGSISKPKWYRRLWILRGVIALIENLRMGYKCLMKSAEIAGIEDGEEELTGFEKKLNDALGDNLMKIVSVIAMIIGVALALFLFSFLPTYTVKLLDNFITSDALKTTAEGIIKIIIFIAYLSSISFMKDVKRLFAYHGAEHKTIACYEAIASQDEDANLLNDISPQKGEASSFVETAAVQDDTTSINEETDIQDEKTQNTNADKLTVENVRKYPRFHPRCGTSFLLIVLILSIIVFSFVSWDNIILRIVFSIAFLPPIAGVSYELIKLAGRHENIFTKILSSPGLLLQRLTTREPEDDQIEVAIAAMLPVMPDNIQEDCW